jgi:hypothetical protein
MTIVRELTTKLGFTFDRTNLDRFERSIIGFKTQATLAAGAIGLTFKKVLDSANEFSNNILQSNAIAKFSKTSIQELKALENVFAKFDVEPKDFNNFFENLSLGIKEASRGVNNEFRDLVTKSGQNVRLYVEDQLTTTKQALIDIKEYAKRFSEDEQIRIVRNVFGVDLKTSEAITQLFKLTNDEFDNLVKKESQSINELNKSIEAARHFKKEINNLNVEWTKFSQNVGRFVVPQLSKSIGGANIFIEKAKDEGIFSVFSFALDSIEDALASFSGVGHLDKIKKQGLEDKEDFYKRLLEQETVKAISNNSSLVTNNNRFEFNVPPGTTEQQATYMSEMVKYTLDAMWSEKTREVINNNPQVE